MISWQLVKEYAVQPYAEPATETFPHHWEAILLSSQALDTEPEVFLPKSFYKNETPEDKLKRWELVLSTVGLILDDDDQMEIDETDQDLEEEDICLLYTSDAADE